MKGEGAYAETIAQRFALAARKIGLSERLQTQRSDLFIKPSPDGQLALF
jgi:hypothetical protein